MHIHKLFCKLVQVSLSHMYFGRFLFQVILMVTKRSLGSAEMRKRNSTQTHFPSLFSWCSLSHPSHFLTPLFSLPSPWFTFLNFLISAAIPASWACCYHAGHPQEGPGTYVHSYSPTSPVTFLCQDSPRWVKLPRSLQDDLPGWNTTHFMCIWPWSLLIFICVYAFWDTIVPAYNLWVSKYVYISAVYLFIIFR